jgi:hypothetical protein
MNRRQFDGRVQLANAYRLVFVATLSWNAACTCQSSRHQSDVCVNDHTYVPKAYVSQCALCLEGERAFVHSYSFSVWWTNSPTYMTRMFIAVFTRVRYLLFSKPEESSPHSIPWYLWSIVLFTWTPLSLMTSCQPWFQIVYSKVSSFSTSVLKCHKQSHAVCWDYVWGIDRTHALIFYNIFLFIITFIIISRIYV